MFGLACFGILCERGYVCMSMCMYVCACDQQLRTRDGMFGGANLVNFLWLDGFQGGEEPAWVHFGLAHSGDDTALLYSCTTVVSPMGGEGEGGG